MATLSNAAIYYESGQAQQAFAAMTAASGNTVFSLATKPWSQTAGYEYRVAPFGLATGGVVTPSAVVANNNVDVAALTAYMAGATGASATTGLLSVGASANVVCARGAGAPTAYIIHSITVDTNGAIAVVTGTGHETAHTETRNVAGGPPLIPVGSIEIAQVRYTSHTAAAVLSTEIYQVVGTHQERYDYPVWSENPLEGKVTFAAALPAIHTGAIPKKVMARVATPIFAEISRARDWVPAETSNSVSSEQYYDSTVGSFSSSLGQASFTASLNDGVTDALLAKKGANLIFKFSPDKNKVPYQLTQGILGVTRTFTAGANPTASFTVSATQASVDVAA
jgi:hypothetical protein